MGLNGATHLKGTVRPGKRRPLWPCLPNCPPLQNVAQALTRASPQDGSTIVAGSLTHQLPDGLAALDEVDGAAVLVLEGHRAGVDAEVVEDRRGHVLRSDR